MATVIRTCLSTSVLTPNMGAQYYPQNKSFYLHMVPRQVTGVNEAGHVGLIPFPGEGWSLDQGDTCNWQGSLLSA